MKEFRTTLIYCQFGDCMLPIPPIKGTNSIEASFLPFESPSLSWLGTRGDFCVTRDFLTETIWQAPGGKDVRKK